MNIPETQPLKAIPKLPEHHSNERKKIEIPVEPWKGDKKPNYDLVS